MKPGREVSRTMGEGAFYSSTSDMILSSRARSCAERLRFFFFTKSLWRL
jgi:hypothetical protein